MTMIYDSLPQSITLDKKHCKRCDRDLSLNMFTKNKHTKDGLTFYCKDCTSEYGRKWRESTAGIYGNTMGRQTYHKNHKMSKYKPVVITLEEFIDWYDNQEKKCVYCGITEEQLPSVDDQFMNGYIRLSVDCMDNDLGYAKGNLVLACRRCNSLKIDFFTYEQMLEIGERFVTPYWDKWLNPQRKIGGHAR